MEAVPMARRGRVFHATIGILLVTGFQLPAITASDVIGRAKFAHVDEKLSGTAVTFEDERNAQRARLENAVQELFLLGGDDFHVCLTANSYASAWFPHLPECANSHQAIAVDPESQSRRLEEDSEEESASYSSSWLGTYSEKIFNAIGALICISIAALAAGLTWGMLGLDPLLLLIKQRASENLVERQQATALLPIVKQHHRLLVTLLLMNAVANEALPIFLEDIVPPSLAILFSVVFVLFFGEIIPSAIFTGPNQMYIASTLVPVVQAAMCILYPLAMPISMLLDCLFHEEEANGSMYNRGELSALIRIQYEERLLTKMTRKAARQKHLNSDHAHLLGNERHHLGALDFPLQRLLKEEHRESLRASLSQVRHSGTQPSGRARSSLTSDSPANFSERTSGLASISEQLVPAGKFSDSIHIDEVTMVEGALSMKVKVALDVLTTWKKTFCIPHTTLLGEIEIVQIYASGFSRIPVYRVDPKNKRVKTKICGILITKHLIVLNPEDNRPVTSMPLYTPLCVSPEIPLVHLLNIFQTGGSAMKGGHMALVCARPRAGNLALEAGGVFLKMLV